MPTHIVCPSFCVSSPAAPFPLVATSLIIDLLASLDDLPLGSSPRRGAILFFPPLLIPFSLRLLTTKLVFIVTPNPGEDVVTGGGFR